MGRSRSTLLGLCLGGTALLALPILVGGASGREDLVVEIPAGHAFSVRSGPRRSMPAALRVYPPAAALTHPVRSVGAGLDLATWSTSYGPAYRREVTWPTLVGPFNDEAQYVCGYSLHAGAGLFDTSGAGKGLVPMFRRELAASLPQSIDLPRYNIHVPLPPLRSVHLGVRWLEGRADLSVAMLFVDGTVFALPRIPVKMVSRKGVPTVTRNGPIARPIFRGPVRDQIVSQAGNEGAFIGSIWGLLLLPLGGPLWGAALGDSMGRDKANSELPRRAQAMATRGVDKALVKLALGMAKLTRPLHPFSSRPGDELRLRLAGDPTVAPDGITLPICARITLAAPRIDNAVPGPIDLEEPGIAAPAAAVGPVIALTMNADAIDQITYYLWQSGTLRRLGESPAVFGAFSREVRAAAFDFKGFSPGLPPVLAPARPHAGGLPFVVGDFGLGAIGARRVAAHGRVALRVSNERDTVTLRATVSDLRVNCVELRGGRARLTPCLADLLPIARAQIAGRPLVQSWGSADLLAKLPALGFEGVQLHLSSLQASTSTRPARLDLSARASFE